MSFDINVNVLVGVTPAVERLLGQMLTTQSPQPLSAFTPPTHTITAPVVAEAPILINEPPFEPLPATVGEVGVKTYGKSDVEDIMHITRIRFEGDNYKTQTQSEGYQKYHRQLNGIFKAIANELVPQCKPTALPPDKIPDFIRECNALYLSTEDNSQILREEAPF